MAQCGIRTSVALNLILSVDHASGGKIVHVDGEDGSLRPGNLIT